MNVIYLIGVPGSGKTTLVESVLKLVDIPALPVLDVPVPHVRYGWLWHVGRPRERFGGTDTLSMSIQPKAIRWLGEIESECEVLLAEGDRLANSAFFDACPNLTIIHLDVPLEHARWRAHVRAVRDKVDPQNETWWKGRVTKTTNLIARHDVIHYDATLPPYLLAADLYGLVLEKAGREESQVAK